jgi:hypothetical protein
MQNQSEIIKKVFPSNIYFSEYEMHVYFNLAKGKMLVNQYKVKQFFGELIMNYVMKLK